MYRTISKRKEGGQPFSIPGYRSQAVIPPVANVLNTSNTSLESDVSIGGNYISEGHNFTHECSPSLLMAQSQVPNPPMFAQPLSSPGAAPIMSSYRTSGSYGTQQVAGSPGQAESAGNFAAAQSTSASVIPPGHGGEASLRVKKGLWNLSLRSRHMQSGRGNGKKKTRGALSS